jgi:glutamate---methylamine ligase
MASELETLAHDRKIKYFLVSFSDLMGTVRAKLVPAAAIGEMERAGAGSPASPRGST